MAGSASSVSAAATISPPMIATAIGSQNTLRDSGIIARTAAAVSTIGLKRRTAASTIASQAGTPCRRSCSIWSIRITELRTIIPNNAITPSSATKPNGRFSTSRAPATPAMPMNPVRKARSERVKPCSCSINSVNMMNSATGSPAAIEPWPLLLSSTAPAIWIA